MPTFDERIALEFFNAKEARQHLQVTKNRFDYYIKLGLITGVELPGYPRLYRKIQVQAVAVQLEAALVAALMSNTVCRQASLEDIDAETNLAMLCFGERALETRELRKAFLQTNPLMTHQLYDTGVLVSSINLLPLTHDAILEFREGKRGWLFPPDTIQQFAPGAGLECIIIDFMTTPLVSPQKRSAYAVKTLFCLVEKLTAWGESGIDITSIDACGSTDNGRRILETAGFTFTGYKGGTRYMYHLELATSKLKLLLPYKRALKKYKDAHSH